MSFMENLLDVLGYSFSSKPLQFDQDLYDHLSALAEQERRSEEEIANDLLCYALSRRGLDKENLQRWRRLSPREQQVTALMCLGYSNKEIAVRLIVAAETIKSHLRNIRLKFDVPSKAELRRSLANWDFSAWEDLIP